MHDLRPRQLEGGVLSVWTPCIDPMTFGSF